MTGVRRSRAATVAALVLLATAACGQSGAEPDRADPTSGESPSASPSRSGSEEPRPDDPTEGSTPAVPVADPEHAVEPPGPREGALVPADLLVYNQEPLDEALVEEVSRLGRVQRIERLSLANVGVENGVITLAAVDPGSYRNYTRREGAELQEAWERVAGGELAVDPQLGTKLKRELKKTDGFLKLGNDKDAPQVHVGAYVPQIPQVDAVVNEEWGEDLGMPLGNALILTTGIHSPRAVMKDVQKIVGDDAAVSILGPNLDPGAVQTAVLTGGSVADAVGTFRYTVLGGGRIAPEASWVEAHIRTEQMPIIGSMTCHRVMFPQLRAALLEIQQRGLADKIHPGEYAGCYYPRYIANTQQLSLHSFGIAFDINVPGNQRGTVGEIDRDIVAIFKRWGFAWGGDWSWTDPMHFEMNAIVHPR